MWQKLKSQTVPFILSERIFTVCLLIAISIASFVLGRYSVTTIISDKPQSRIAVTMGSFTFDEQTVSARNLASVTSTQPIAVANQVYVASKSGARYHHVSCPGAKQIKEENKIFFSTPQAAEAAGYTKAANCKI